MERERGGGKNNLPWERDGGLNFRNEWKKKTWYSNINLFIICGM